MCRVSAPFWSFADEAEMLWMWYFCCFGTRGFFELRRCGLPVPSTSDVGYFAHGIVGSYWLVQEQTLLLKSYLSLSLRKFCVRSCHCSIAKPYTGGIQRSPVDAMWSQPVADLIFWIANQPSVTMRRWIFLCHRLDQKSPILILWGFPLPFLLYAERSIQVSLTALVLSVSSNWLQRFGIFSFSPWDSWDGWSRARSVGFWFLIGYTPFVYACFLRQYPWLFSNRGWSNYGFLCFGLCHLY